jgi:hypothetical protein
MRSLPTEQRGKQPEEKRKVGNQALSRKIREVLKNAQGYLKRTRAITLAQIYKTEIL